MWRKKSLFIFYYVSTFLLILIIKSISVIMLTNNFSLGTHCKMFRAQLVYKKVILSTIGKLSF